EAEGGAGEAQRVGYAAGERLVWVFLVVQQVVIVDLEDERYRARVIARAGFQETERRRIRVAACFDCQFEMIARIISRRVGCEAARGTMFESLIHGQDNHLAGAGEPPMI